MQNDAVSNETTMSRLPGAAGATSQLEQLAERANAAHHRVDQAARQNLFAALEAGQSLLQARKLCLGEWLVWLAKNFKASARTAQRYMAFATETRQIGGLDATRVSHLTPQELGHIWTMLLREPSGRKKRKATGTKALPSSPAPDEATVASGTPRSVAQREGDQAADGPLRPLAELFKQLIDGLRLVMNGDDDDDGPWAQSLVCDLEPHYADLLEYLDYRKERRG